MSEIKQSLTEDEFLEERETDTPTVSEGKAPEEESCSPYDELNEEELRDTVAELVQVHEVLKQEKAELAEQKAAVEVELQRMAADFQNARKRLDRLAQEQVERASQRFAGKIIAVMDDLELALANRPPAVLDSNEPWLQGIEQIRTKIRKVLEEEGVTLIESTGAFDPGQHEAVQQLESESHESGEIVDTVRPGYMFKDQVLRPAMVRIAS